MIAANTNLAEPGGQAAGHGDFVTVTVAGQVFGLPIGRVRDAFVATALTPVPLAPSEVVGLLNLRGRVVTALCLRRRLGLPDRAAAREIAVGIEHRGESYGLLVDAVGEVITLTAATFEPNPAHLSERRAGLSRGVHRLEGKLLVILDIDAVLSFGATAQAA